VRRMLSAGTQMQHRQKLRARIDGQPQPELYWLLGTSVRGKSSKTRDERD
jgi:hypothetical protein